MTGSRLLLHVRGDDDGPVEPDGTTVRTARTEAEAVAVLTEIEPDVVVCEHDLDGDATGLDVLAAIRDQDPNLPVVLCTDDPDGQVAAKATQLGVTEYVPRSEVSLDARLAALNGHGTTTDRSNMAVDLPPSFDALAGSISDAIVTIDAESRIVYANDRLADLIGHQSDDLVGNDFTALMPGEYQQQHLDGVARYLRQGERSFEWTALEFPLLTDDGEELTVSVSFGDFEIDGEWYCTGIVRDISERKEREEELAALNRRLELALDGTETGVYEWNVETGEVVWDEATAALFGTTPEEFGGTVDAFREYVHTDDKSSLDAAFERALETDDQFEAEFRVTVGGTTRWIYTNGVVEKRSDRSPRLVAIATDVTDQKERELELERTNESLHRLTELAAADAQPEDATVERVLELGADRLGLALGYLSRIDGTDYEVVSVVGDHDVVQEGVETDLANTYCRRIVDSESQQFGVRDAAAEGWEDDMAYQISGIACYLGGKVVVDGELYGTLCFADDEPRDEPFTEAEQTYIELLAGWVSRELERRQREADLERYEDVIEAVDDGVYALDETGHFQLVNDAMTDLTGYEESALLGAHTSAIKSDKVVERAESIVQEMIFGDREDEETFDLEIQRADGTSFPAEDHMTLLWDDDGEWFEGTAGIIRDITERKERELELREAHRRIEQILERIGDAFFAVDDTWEITYWNTRAEEVLGEAADEALGENLWSMFPDAVGSQFHDAYHRAMDTQEMVTFEEYYPPVERWFRVSAYPSEGGLSVYFHDITDQKEYDRKLSGLLDTSRSLMDARTSEAVAETVIEAASEHLGFDLSLVRLYDEDEETLVPTAATADLPQRPVYGADEAYPGEAFQRGETVRVDDFEAHSDDYDNRIARAAMYIPLGGHGIISIASPEPGAFDDADVSVAEILASNAAAALDRVEREQHLLEYETVVENVRDMVYVLDEVGQFQLVTEPLATWLGFEREELLDEHPRAVLDTDSLSVFEDQIAALRSSDSDETLQVETTLKTADGAERPAEVEISILDDDIFNGTVGVVRDLTDLREAQAELEDERDRFSYLFDNLPDAVVEAELSNGEPVVKSVNPAFTEVFGFDAEAVVDEPLNDLVLPLTDEARAEATRIDAKAARGETVKTEVRRQTDRGIRDFLYRGVPYNRDDEQVWGFGIYSDITEQRDRERRLEVLNRVLRHNLRNDLTVVLGLADELSSRIDDGRLLDLLDRLQRKASEVAELSDRARQIEQSARREEAGRHPVDVPAVVEDIVDATRPGSDGEMVTAIPDTSAEAADGRFRRILDELLDNAITHAGESPTVKVDVTVDDETVSVTVADDGPGLPEHELAVVTGQEPITQLSHGSGLGLWLVIWVTESYGGTVTFDDSDAGGAEITMTVPRTDV
ncbi:PAS domain S-box protein [Halomicroarcula sp. GCM10025324]|uniref:PAS domain S-box protein n=1 Tax=Haloarcula TaxID=2237 RepID=UPI0023E8C568|nr:PAS domain S-box protein [Halomicroarcula sp. ZS-22-S1]